MLNGPVQRFLLRSFERLDQRRISYAVVRNVEELSHPLPGTDVDIIVRKEDADNFLSLLDETCQEQGGFLSFRGLFLGNHQSLYFFSKAEKGPLTVNIDLKEDLTHRGMVLFAAEDLLKCRRRWREIWRPSYAHESVGLLFHAVLDKGRFRKGYAEKILELREQDREGFSRVLRSRIGLMDVQWVESCLDNGRTWEELLQPDRWIASLISQRKSRRWALWQWRVRQGLRMCGWALTRRGALVAILGPDGVGKTTLIDALSHTLGKLPVKVVRVYFGVRTPLLPTKRLLRAFHEKRQAAKHRKSKSIEKPNEQKPWAHFLGTMHNLLDEVLRYWAYARWPLARRSIVLCDRYPYDAVITHAPLGLYFIVSFAIRHLVPRPDLTIVLTGNSEEIYRRKPELSIGELERRQKCYDRLCNRHFHGKKVVVDRPPQEIANRLMTDVMIAFGKRNA